MPFCPKCRSEYRQGFDRCADCDVALVESLPPAAAPEPAAEPPARLAFGTLKPLHATTFFAEAESLCAALDAAGIESSLENEAVASLALGLPTSAIPLRIVVREADFPAAREVLAEFLKEKSSPRAGVAPVRSVLRGRWKWAAAGALLFLGLYGQPHDEAIGGFLVWSAWLIIVASILVFLRERHDSFRIPIWRLTAYLAYGAIVAPIVAALIEASVPDRELHSTAGAFLLIGPVEEVLKILVPFLMIAFARSWRNRPCEWFVAALAASAGFGMTENLFYYGALSGGSSIVWLAVRAAVLSHMIESGFVGYLAGRGRPEGVSTVFRIISGLIAASLLHGAWDALAFAGLPGLVAVLFLAELVVFAWNWRRMIWRLVRRSAQLRRGSNRFLPVT